MRTDLGVSARHCAPRPGPRGDVSASAARRGPPAPGGAESAGGKAARPPRSPAPRGRRRSRTTRSKAAHRGRRAREPEGAHEGGHDQTEARYAPKSATVSARAGEQGEERPVQREEGVVAASATRGNPAATSGHQRSREISPRAQHLAKEAAMGNTARGRCPRLHRTRPPGRTGRQDQGDHEPLPGRVNRASSSGDRRGDGGQSASREVTSIGSGSPPGIADNPERTGDAGGGYGGEEPLTIDEHPGGPERRVSRGAPQGGAARSGPWRPRQRSGISYGMPAFRLNGKLIAGLRAAASHRSFHR